MTRAFSVEPPTATAAVSDAINLAGGVSDALAAAARALDAAGAITVPPAHVAVAIGYDDTHGRTATLIRAVPLAGFLRAVRRAKPFVGAYFERPEAGQFGIAQASKFDVPRPPEWIADALLLARHADADPSALRSLLQIIGVAADRLGLLSSLDEGAALLASVDPIPSEGLFFISIVIAPAPRADRA